MTTKNQFKIVLITGLIVTSYITFTVVAFNAGFENNFITKWLKSWFIAFILVVPSLLYLAPFIRKKLD
jgi:ABC-type multidrug transport system permease subunit